VPAAEFSLATKSDLKAAWCVRVGAAGGFGWIRDVTLVPPSRRLSRRCSLVLPTVTSQKGCGNYYSASSCVFRSPEVAGEYFVSVIKQEGPVFEVKASEFDREDVYRIFFK
jgi:hypothetical protein